MPFSPPPLGHGIGLRPKHFSRFLEGVPPIAWVEATSENHMANGGRPVVVLEKVRRDMPVVLHGVSLSIGSTDPLSHAYLTRLEELVSRIEPAMVSDHLCWGTHGGHHGHDLWPLPFTEEALRHVVSRVDVVQERLGRRILLENVSSYLSYPHSTLSEWAFLSEVARRADCGILLDVNNVYVSAFNHGFSAQEYLEGLPTDRIGQIHLAGHTDCQTHLLDSHDAMVSPGVWSLYQDAVRRFGPVPTLIEWDDHIPELETLLEESKKAEALEQHVLKTQRATA